MVKLIGRHRKSQEEITSAYAAVKHLGDRDAAKAMGLNRNSVYTYRASHPEARPDNWMTGTERKELRSKKDDVQPAPRSVNHSKPRQTILFSNPDGRVNRVSLAQAPWVSA